MKPTFLARCALFSALLCVCAWISIPIGNMTFTLQSFALILALFLLGGRGATVSVAVYLLLGAVGLPVFSGFRGGLGALLNVNGGYLWGFLISCFVFLGITSIFGEKSNIYAAVASMVIVYICGTVWFTMYAPGALIPILAQSVLPYLLPDAVKFLLAYFLSGRLKRLLPA
ncbi:MAG: biotin transporter BioY [Oscillospiraceae bacterium]|nr:biotin transporter BioY [Oscillospiraceae bacterium]MBQ9929371.1 biotin transporter BioY [Oscillospiraceae bacterium]